ncbi:carboxylesterase/lipase family protein [Yinghuangia seranimata]|uniref:carboxylesterase/lipase family protein n=1 Tax=Yinghuangia seranimata TaxID=408067 RepID=UPI00248C7A9B|nr:carboxylesterase family protein [Yinghuangia seranimata]MDI2131090.1 carboxylesterase family protein [Yinghuangia seranimata]
MPSNVEVQTAHGPVTGRTTDGVTSFLGVPYAAPPVGANRFNEPVEPDAWTEPLPALAFGPTAPRDSGGRFDRLLGGTPVPGDGWLTVNVWTPDTQPSERLPVMVWIHGGAFLRGSSAGTAYDGSTFARDGVVCVSVNYRLGVEGFAYIPDAPVPANRGLLDQALALRWVRYNIQHFGGDPSTVTVFGESAGAMSILAMLSAELGLFERAIVQSGTAHLSQTSTDALLLTKELAEKLSAEQGSPVEPSFAALSKFSPESLIAAQQSVHNDVVATADAVRFGQTTIDSCGMSFQPVVDASPLRGRPIDLIANRGAGSGVPLLIGTTVEENRYFVLQNEAPEFPPRPEDWQQRLTVYGVPKAKALYDWYVEARKEAYPRELPAEVFAAVMTDRLFRIPSYRVAEARANVPSPSTTYVYELGWRTGKADYLPGVALGACHVSEIPFVWDTVEAEGVDKLIADPPAGLARRIHARWVEFAKKGHLEDWEQYHLRERPVMSFCTDNTDTTGMVNDPRSFERELWHGALDPEP